MSSELPLTDVFVAVSSSINFVLHLAMLLDKGWTWQCPICQRQQRRRRFRVPNFVAEVVAIFLPICCHMQFGGSEAEILEKVSRLEKQVEDLANRLAVPTQDQVPTKKKPRESSALFFVFSRDQLSFGNLRIQSHTA